MAKNRNTYQILKSCFVTGGTSTLATVSNTYELFKAVYDTSAGALRISLSGGTGVSTLEGLTDTLITSPVGGQILAWNGSVWVNSASGSTVPGATELWVIDYVTDNALSASTLVTDIGGYTTGTIDGLFTQADSNYLSANTSFYTQAEVDGLFTQADSNYLSANTSLFDGEFASLANIPTTISGYGITDAYTKTEIDNNTLSGDTVIPTDFYSKAEVDANTLSANTALFDGEFASLSNIPTTISGYGITDAYTQTEVDNYFLTGSTVIPTDFYSKAEVDANTLSANTSLFDGAFSSLTGKPTTISGYGITDAYTSTEVDNNFLTGSTSLFDGAFSSLTGVPTTIAGYGITNAYTKTEVDALISSSSTGATQLWVTDNFLSGNTVIPTDFYSQSAVDGFFTQADANYLSANTSLFDGAFSSLTGKPTTIAGYGITDVWTRTESDGNYLSATTSIPTDFYSQSEVDGFFTQADSDYLSANTSFYTQSAVNDLFTQSDSDYLSANTSLFDGAFSSLTGKPTTISGYGITDAYTQTETDGNFLSANTSYYTEAEADANFLSGNTSIMGTGATGLVENMSMQLEFTTGVSYYLVSKSAYDFDVNSINFACDIGTTTISLKYDSAFPQGSATNIFSSVTGGTSLEEYTTDSSNTVAAGKNLMLRVDSITAEATTLYATIKTTRV